MSNRSKSSEIVIESGVPIPPRGGKTRGSMYPFAKMEAGDSFGIPATADRLEAVRRNIQGAASGYGKRHGKKFTTRVLATEVRVWRVA